MNRISLPVGIVQAVVDNLEAQPYKTVAALLNAIAQNQQPVEEPKNENLPVADKSLI